MTRQLRAQPEALGVLVSMTAAGLSVPAAYVEKDFWITEILRVASRSSAVGVGHGVTEPSRLIFKGGTSLSRVFGIVNRFSEDIDLLAVFPARASLSARHSVIKKIDSEVRNHLALSEDDVVVESSTTGIKRYTSYFYPRRNADSSLKEGILLELGSRGGWHPSGEHEYRSLLAQFATAELGEEESSWEEFAPFVIRVLAPERTLLEKLAAVHDAASRGDLDRIVTYGRHFYDIHCLLRSDDVRAALTVLGPSGVRDLAEDIEHHSKTSGLPSTARPEGGYGLSPAFDTGLSLHAEIARGYEAAQALVYGQRVPLNDAMNTVHASRDLI
jgi:hypothetical protein